VIRGDQVSIISGVARGESAVHAHAEVVPERELGGSRERQQEKPQQRKTRIAENTGHLAPTSCGLDSSPTFLQEQRILRNSETWFSVLSSQFSVKPNQLFTEN
jgi:hypothetical protein